MKTSPYLPRLAVFDLSLNAQADDASYRVAERLRRAGVRHFQICQVHNR
jgi:hypothetical protein